MERLSEEDRLLLEEAIDVLDEETSLIEETLEEAERVKQEVKFPKQILYFSDNLFVYKFVQKVKGHDYTMIQVYDRNNKESHYYHIADPKMVGSILLNIINRGEQGGYKKGSV